MSNFLYRQIKLGGTKLEDTNAQAQNKPFSVYCNGIQISLSPYDFTFFLNRNSQKGDTLLGEIKMSPEHALAFANMLLNHVQNYEDIFGKIPQIDQNKLQQLQKEGKIEIKENK